MRVFFKVGCLHHFSFTLATQHFGLFLQRFTMQNATPDQIPDSESQDIVQVLQDNDACEFDNRSKFEVQIKGNLRLNVHFWRGIGASSFSLSVIEEGYRFTFFRFPEPAALKNNRSALAHAEFVQSALEVLCKYGRNIRCVPFCRKPPFLYLCRPTVKRG